MCEFGTNFPRNYPVTFGDQAKSSVRLPIRRPTSWRRIISRQLLGRDRASRHSNSTCRLKPRSILAELGNRLQSANKSRLAGMDQLLRRLINRPQHHFNHATVVEQYSILPALSPVITLRSTERVFNAPPSHGLRYPSRRLLRPARFFSALIRTNSSGQCVIGLARPVVRHSVHNNGGH